MAEKFPVAVHSAISVNFEGRKSSVMAAKMKPSVIKELAGDLPAVRTLDGAIKDILRHYKVINPDMDKVMTARSQLFSNIGKLALKVGTALEQASVKAATFKRLLNQHERSRILQDATKGQLADIESKYRIALTGALGDDDAMPQRLYAVGSSSSTSETTESQGPIAVAGLITRADEDVVELTESIVKKRLQISNLPAAVVLANLEFLKAEDQRLYVCRYVIANLITWAPLLRHVRTYVRNLSIC